MSPAGFVTARIAVPIEAFDARGASGRLRLFTTTGFVSEVSVGEPATGGEVRVALYRRETVSAATGERLAWDGAFLVIDEITVDLRGALAGRSVVDRTTGRAVPSVTEAIHRSPYGTDLERAAALEPSRRSRWGTRAA